MKVNHEYLEAIKYKYLKKLRGVFRTIGFLFINAWIFFEYIIADKQLSQLIPWNAGLFLAIEAVLYLVVVISFYVSGIIYCIHGFRDWFFLYGKGWSRICYVVRVLFIIVLFLYLWGLTENWIYALICAGGTAVFWCVCILIYWRIDEGFDEDEEKLAKYFVKDE